MENQGRRYNYGNEWFDLAALPIIPIDSFMTDIIETHWPNVLAQDDFLQDGITNQWIEYFRNIQAKPDRYLAKNTEQFFSQWLYNRYAVLHFIEQRRVLIDNTLMPDEAYSSDLLGNIVEFEGIYQYEWDSVKITTEKLIKSFTEELPYEILLENFPRKSH